MPPKGRPKLPWWRRRDYELRIRLDGVERLFLADECAASGMTLSDYVRSLVRREMSRPVETGEWGVVGQEPDGYPIEGELTEPLRNRLVRRVTAMTPDALEAYVFEQLDVTDYEVD